MRRAATLAACALALGGCSTESPLDVFDAVEGFERAVDEQDFDKACRDFVVEKPLYEPSEVPDRAERRRRDQAGTAAEAGGCPSLVRALYTGAKIPGGEARRRETSLETATAVCTERKGVEQDVAYTLEQVDGRWRIVALPGRPCKF